MSLRLLESLLLLFNTVSCYAPLFEWEPLWAIGAIHSFALGRKYPWWSHVHNTNNKQRAIEKAKRVK